MADKRSKAFNAIPLEYMSPEEVIQYKLSNIMSYIQI